MTPQLSRREVVAGLINLATKAVELELTDDAAEILQGARILRPRMVELDLLEGWICIQRGQVDECIRLMRNVEASPTHWGMAKALMARCQRFLKDPAWRANADEVLAGCKDPTALYLVQQLVDQQSIEAGTDAAGQGDRPPAPGDAPDPQSAALPRKFAPVDPLTNPFVFQLRA
ncbi:HrpB1 family type III secretion system apparatus protein [Paracidovorax citrulli]|uniref:HrpB1 family type III secretion system apparatus protein n=1 Tax=Paracidovorax citrulli TaxID=80869 RepID=UPI0006628815|nr:HrpB1 family type III secretion system apparatus protein [Paracidovorax citrulli]QCX11150.1 HrpB1 family type III secretion system apparatus protein [Paracidovorax citrulli]UEG45878.1 HrpB1 family type III secretion system apparatus protein [Paracidovorax citrulli]UMT86826.1 serine kinase [Paracidovorax citrulli]UMT94867.1 serine kinase [Paracidovorax citrulli]WIY34333.1 HrpB1 family type III secretion system apparatus protein [Paracidovorax citrulli]